MLATKENTTMCIRNLSIAVLLIIGAHVADLASAANWPRFRGSNGTGIATDKGVPVKWNGEEAVLWKTAVPGVGHSSPIIWDDHLLLQSATEEGKERLLLCYNATNGKLL